MFTELATLTKKNQLQNCIFNFEFESEQIARTAKPGQFVNVLVNGLTLRRPFSICEIINTKIRIGFKIKGDGTKQMACWDVGKTVNILGPLGKGFLQPKFDDRILLVGGGVGCFALLEFAKHCHFCYTVLGFKNDNQIILQNEFAKLGTVKLCIENSIQSNIPKLVTEPIENLIKTQKINRIACCGPTPMMKAVFEIAKNYGVFCEVCLEERMACGIGACLGCQCKIKKDNQIQSKHVCCDGPVFNAEEVFFCEQS